MHYKQYLNIAKYFFTIALFFLLFWIFSCKNYKSLTYFVDESDAEAKLYHQIDKPQDYVIKKNDNLYISIQSLNPELNAIYNPAIPSNTTGLGGTGGTQTNYGNRNPIFKWIYG